MNNLLTGEKYTAPAKRAQPVADYSAAIAQVQSLAARAESVHRLEADLATAQQTIAEQEREGTRLESELAAQVALVAQQREQIAALQSEARAADARHIAALTAMGERNAAAIAAIKLPEQDGKAEAARLQAMQSDMTKSNAEMIAEVRKVGIAVASVANSVSAIPKPPDELEFVPRYDGAGNVLSITARGKK